MVYFYIPPPFGGTPKGYKEDPLIHKTSIVKDITKGYLFSPNYPNIIYIFKTFVYGFWIFLGIFYMFLYLTNGDILGIIQAYLDLTKEKLFDMGFGNWVGLN